MDVLIVAHIPSAGESPRRTREESSLMPCPN
jgi:hypothetical protein